MLLSWSGNASGSPPPEELEVVSWELEVWASTLRLLPLEFRPGAHAGGLKRGMLFSLEEVLWHCDLQRCVVETTQSLPHTIAFGHDGCPPATSLHRRLPLDASAPLEAPLFHWRKKPPPDHDVTPSTVPCRKHLRWDLPVMPVTKAIRTIEVAFFSRQRIKPSSTFQCPTLGALVQSLLCHWIKVRTFFLLLLFLKPFSRKCL